MVQTTVRFWLARFRTAAITCPKTERQEDE